MISPKARGFQRFLPNRASTHLDFDVYTSSTTTKKNKPPLRPNAKPTNPHKSTMLPRLRARAPTALRSTTSRTTSSARRTLIAAPKPNSGPLMERRADRALPPLSSRNAWLRTLPAFAAVMAACTLAIFNYQKSNSSVVSSALYSLRTNGEARRLLGDEIYFAQQLPWIWGKIDQVHGEIDVRFGVRGTRGRGEMRLRCVRRERMGFVSFSLVFSGGGNFGGLVT